MTTLPRTEQNLSYTTHEFATKYTEIQHPRTFTYKSFRPSDSLNPALMTYVEDLARFLLKEKENNDWKKTF